MTSYEFEGMLPALSSDAPSPGLRRLLSTKLDTFEKVELVGLLAKRANRQDTVTELARALQVGHEILERLAIDLGRTGLVVVADGTVRLVASAAELASIEEGAQMEPRKLMSLLSAVALDRIRGMAARSFADAFTLRKKKDGGDG